MQLRPRKVLSILPLALLFSTAGFAQLTAINGDVKGVDGKPVVGAMVKIDRTDQKGSYKVKTDKKGHYYYGGLGLGVWTVTIEVDGKDVDQMKAVNTQHGDAEVNFDLKKTAERAAAAAASAGAGAPPPPAAEQERGMTAAQKADFEKKKKDAEAAMAKQKDLNDAFAAGREAEDAKNWDTAIEQYKKAAVIDPKQHVVLSHMADCYIKLGDSKSGDDRSAAYAAAVDNYKKALELSPDDPVYHNNYALALVKDKKVDEAQTELTKAAQLDPTSAGKYYYNLGRRAGERWTGRSGRRRVQEIDRRRSELRGSVLSARNHAGGQGDHRAGWKDRSTRRDRGSVPEVSRTGPHRPERGRSQGNAGFDGSIHRSFVSKARIKGSSV